MYPNIIFLGMSLYEIMLAVGVIAALSLFRILADKRGFTAKFQNFILIDAFIMVVLGYFFAVLFQAIYNAFETGVFEIANDTGATFLGGLIGGAAVFFIIYIPIGHFVFKDGYNMKILDQMVSIGATCVALAHGFGRVGCFFAGCCYGLPNEKFGIYMESAGCKVLPTQLYESIFLFILATVLIVLHVKKPDFNLGLPIYMISYGIWRFFLEYLRGDYRGEFIVKFLTPSQFWSCLLFIGGIVLLIVLVKFNGRRKNKVENN